MFSHLYPTGVIHESIENNVDYIGLGHNPETLVVKFHMELFTMDIIPLRKLSPDFDYQQKLGSTGLVISLQ